jgi:putative nucleotidyltransferase with HDIG domain
MFGRKPEPRLENWDGRRHSTRGCASVFPRVWSRAAALRLALVVLTAGSLVALLFAHGPPFPYRLHSVLPHDFRARVAFDVPNEAFAARQVEETPEAGTGESPAVDHYAAGAILVRRGQRIDGPKLVLLAAEHRAYAARLSLADRAARLLSLGLIVYFLAGLAVAYVVRFEPALAKDGPHLLGVCGLVFLATWLALLLSRPPWDAVIVPLTVAAMVLAIVFSAPFALLVSAATAAVVSLGLGTGLNALLVHAGGLATAVLALREVRSRGRPVRVGALAAGVFLALTVATGLLADQPARLFLADGLRAGAWSLLAGFILCGALPLVERAFGVMTDATLLELADGSHPLMQELVRRAPGTYTHSMTVATLAEAAAEAVGANPLLARVGSHFHDVGKMLKPHYFIENQSGENRHDGLEPALSTLVIVGHVKDGVALACQYGLPRPIVDFIRQHHGTTLVEFFYREALRLQEKEGEAGGLEHAFRYPGPKPQSREAGILMLADAVESASRALPAPTPNGLRKLVRDLLMKRLLDGQFDECGLTMAELRRIEESLAKSLIAVFHVRIRYQEMGREAS